jgi:hypothetical protein
LNAVFSWPDDNKSPERGKRNTPQNNSANQKDMRSSYYNDERGAANSQN